MNKLVDKGPWTVSIWPAKTGTRTLDREQVVLQSDVFEHDVALIVNGDFASRDDKISYANDLAKQLNEGVKALKEKGWT